MSNRLFTFFNHLGQFGIHFSNLRLIESNGFIFEQSDFVLEEVDLFFRKIAALFKKDAALYEVLVGLFQIHHFVLVQFQKLVQIITQLFDDLLVLLIDLRRNFGTFFVVFCLAKARDKLFIF